MENTSTTPSEELNQKLCVSGWRIKAEALTTLKDLRRFVDPVEGGTQINVAPNGSPVFTRDIGTQEICALTVKWL